MQDAIAALVQAITTHADPTAVAKPTKEWKVRRFFEAIGLTPPEQLVQWFSLFGGISGNYGRYVIPGLHPLPFAGAVIWWGIWMANPEEVALLRENVPDHFTWFPVAEELSGGAVVVHCADRGGRSFDNVGFDKSGADGAVEPLRVASFDWEGGIEPAFDRQHQQIHSLIDLADSWVQELND